MRLMSFLGFGGGFEGGMKKVYLYMHDFFHGPGFLNAPGGEDTSI